ncbi:MAG: hypothetical protein JO235_18370 [Chroococcidiopsidaceae cyanobacterium CP_BM_RX_35]|nr:hypothetical protein [Chroococcidiopsidaceae cyanobacterium CP_BM_RX_35]
MNTKPEQQVGITDRLAPVQLFPHRRFPCKLAPIRLTTSKSVGECNELEESMGIATEMTQKLAAETPG